MLTGAGPAGGHLPVATEHFPLGHGMPWMGRMRWATPIATAAIDSIVFDAIDGGAMPGCRGGRE